jgi:ATP-binding cassette subfamily B protein
MGVMSGGYRSLKRLEDYVGDGRRTIHRCILLSLVATVLLYLVPFICGRLLDWMILSYGTGSMDLGRILDVCTVILLLVVIWYVATTHSSSRMTDISLLTSKRMRTDMNRKMMNVPIGYIDRMPAGDLSSRFVSDLPAVINLISTDYVGFLVHLTMVIAIIFMMFITSPSMGLFYIVTIPLLMLIVRRLVRASEEDYLTQKVAVARLNTHMSDIITTHRTIKSENLGDDYLEDFKESNRNYTEAFITSETRSGMIAPLVSLVTNLGYVSSVILGLWLMLQGSIEIGMFLSFMIYVRTVTNPLMMTARVFNGLREELISLDRIMEVLEAPEEGEGGSQCLDDVKGRMSVEDVSFSYVEGREVLHSVSFDIEPGKITALVGRTASGKSTVAGLMMGFYRPDSGTIRLDGVDISNISRECLGRNVSAVLQNPWIFDGTIRENIVYNRQGVTEEHIREVAGITGLDDYVKGLPEGYDTVVGEDMKRLPLAQRRMLAITRALIGDPKVLILDEAVAGLDPITGQKIFENLKDNAKGRAVVIISHNPVLISQADVVIRMQDGRVVEA